MADHPDDSLSPRRRPRVAITLGDPNGIGPEVVLKCLADSRIRKYVDPVLVGSPAVLRAHAARLDLGELPIRAADAPSTNGAIGMIDVAAGETPIVAFGEVAAPAGKLAMQAVQAAADMALKGQVDAIVTAPISKQAIVLAGHDFPGHTEFLAQRSGSSSFTMMLVAEKLRIGLLTAHIPIWNVPKRVTKGAVVHKIHALSQSLIKDFAIQRPKIAVLGLNPHAGEGGVLGREETSKITPAIEKSCEEGRLAFVRFPQTVSSARARIATTTPFWPCTTIRA